MSRAGRPSVRRAKLRALYLLPSIPDDAPTAWKNALAVRNSCATTGRCSSCGARGELQGPDRHGLLHLVFAHEDDCVALFDGDVVA